MPSLTHASAARSLDVKSSLRLYLFRPPSHCTAAIRDCPSAVGDGTNADFAFCWHTPSLSLSLFISIADGRRFCHFLPLAFVSAATLCCHSHSVTALSHPLDRSGQSFSRLGCSHYSAPSSLAFHACTADGRTDADCGVRTDHLVAAVSRVDCRVRRQPAPATSRSPAAAVSLPPPPSPPPATSC